jgi:hypothetical protein
MTVKPDSNRNGKTHIEQLECENAVLRENLAELRLRISEIHEQLEPQRRSATNGPISLTRRALRRIRLAWRTLIGASS